VWLGGSSDFTIVELEHAVFTSFSERISASDFTIVELELRRLSRNDYARLSSDFTIVELEPGQLLEKFSVIDLLVSP